MKDYKEEIKKYLEQQIIFNNIHSSQIVGDKSFYIALSYMDNMNAQLQLTKDFTFFNNSLRYHHLIYITAYFNIAVDNILMNHFNNNWDNVFNKNNLNSYHILLKTYLYILLIILLPAIKEFDNNNYLIPPIRENKINYQKICLLITE